MALRQLLRGICRIMQAGSYTDRMPSVSQGLLSTKLHIPSAPVQPTPRPRLLRLLDDGLKRKLILVSAPAGFGKTTLLSEWTRQCSAAAAWLSLDETDNDFARFIAYLVAAMQTVERAVGEATLAAFRFPQPPPLDSVLIPLLNDMSAIQKPFVLVLDDYHLIQAEPIHDALILLLERMPPQAHIAVLTRADPPLHLGRLRGRGQLAELRETDLRFTREEAAAFLNQVMELSLSADEIASLHERTEGWIAGLHLAAVSIRQAEDVARFVSAFSGSHEYIVDYLTDEVLSQQPEEVRKFLLVTSILDRLSGPLCDAVTGQRNGRERLAQLRAANLFLVALDNERHWHRYHPLLADVLRARLSLESPGIIPELHRRASVWHEENGLIPQAIHHALAAQDFERAASLIERVAEATMMRSEIATMLTWVEALPDDLVRARPRLSVLHAAALLMAGHPVEIVEARLRETAPSSDIVAFRAVVSTFRGDVRESEDLSRRALEDLPGDSLFVRSVIAWNLAIAGMLGGNFKASLEAMEEAIRVGRLTGNQMIGVVALCHKAEITMMLGRMREAEALYREATDMAVDERGHLLPAVGFAQIGLGELLRERNALDAAEPLLEEGIRNVGQSGILGLIDGYLSLARVRQARGDADGANLAIEQAGQVAAKFDATEVDDHFVTLHRVRLEIAQGRLQAARTRLAEHDQRRKASAITRHDFLDTIRKIALARLLIAEGQADEALELLGPLLETLVKRGWVAAELEALGLCALALQEQDNIDQAIATLERSLRLAEPEGYARIFLDEGAPMGRVLHEAARRGVMPEYSRRLLAQFPPASVVGSHPVRQDPLVEPLSQRELDVLRLIAEGLTNADIARKLFISVPTVKWHTTNIYGKLGVRSRGQAVARARGLGLLTDSA